ncbi:hypothetical protein AMTRI_Chr08g207690 [Amborella trichopoda]
MQPLNTKHHLSDHVYHHCYPSPLKKWSKNQIQFKSRLHHFIQRKPIRFQPILSRNTGEKTEGIHAFEDEKYIVNGICRRQAILKPLLAVGFCFLHSKVRAEEAPLTGSATKQESDRKEAPLTGSTVKPESNRKEETLNSRIYDANVIGEPLALGKDKSRVWDKLLNSRIVYLGEAEQVPVRDDKDLELEIVKNLRNKCFEQQRPISLALEAFPCDIQEQLNQYMSKRIDGETLKSFVPHWPPERWPEYEPLLRYCCDNGVRLVACGTPLEVLRTVQAEGMRGLSKADRNKYAPPNGAGFINGFTSISRRSPIDMISPNPSLSFGPSSYLSAQARVIDDYTMSQAITQAMQDGGSVGVLVVVTGASHVLYGSRGVGLPARISKQLLKKNQSVILLNPERQHIRKEGEAPVADFLWYSAARPCSRNCFDRAEIARVMNAAGRRRDALPQDIQKGLDLGVVSPEVLQSFFDLEQYPLISELTHRFQGFRERLLADPKFLHRLAIEEAISITTTLLAQYERRKENFFEELDYVITDTLRGSVVDFFTVWLPAPTLSFLSVDENVTTPENLEILKGFFGSIPDNAFQKSSIAKDWNLSQRFASVLIGGLKLTIVGFISSIGAVTSSNMLFNARRVFNPALEVTVKQKRSPIFKTALVYGSFLGVSANLRYQVIAGIVEHRISDEFLSSKPVLVNMLSFAVRTVNSYWGTQQWIDLARATGIQTRNKINDLPYEAQDIPVPSTLESSAAQASNVEEANNNAGDNSVK